MSDTFDTYALEHPPVVLTNQQEQEAVNLVLTGTALAAHSTGNEVLIFGSKAATEPPEPPVEPPPLLGELTETGIVQWPVAVADTDIALVAAPTTAIVGSVFLIDAEYMTVVSMANPDNPQVERATLGSTAAVHAAGAEVLIYGQALAPPTGDPTETGEVQWPVAETDTDIALVTTPTTVVVGSTFLIDAEYMIVSGISNPDNPNVTRGAYGSVVAAHAAGVAVTIWGQVMKSAQARPPKTAAAAKVSAPEPREETKREEAKRERVEQQEEEEAEERKEKKQKSNATAKSKSAKKK